MGACGTCMDARDVQDSQFTEEVLRSNMEELTDWLLWADMVEPY